MIKKNFLGIFLLFTIVLLSFSISAYITSTTQYSQYSPTTTKTQMDQSICKQGQDFVIQISPFGCTPAVVRSDLLEENDVPVYCSLGATKINPLIDVNVIDSVSFSGSYPKEVAGIGFHPAKAALGVKDSLNSPVLNNIGYVVILLKKQSNVSAIPDSISGNLTASIKYNINKAFGIGQALFYLPELSEKDWQAQKYKSSFWSGRGYLRADAINNDNAEVSVYSGDTKISSVTLKKGETSNSVYLPGFECQAGLKLQLNDLVNPDTRAQLVINSEVVEVAQGEKFLDNKCSVNSLAKKGLVQQVTIRCTEDTGTTTSTMAISPKIVLNVDGQDKEYNVGDYLYNQGNNRIYLAFLGTKGSVTSSSDMYAYFLSSPVKTEDKLSDDEISSISTIVGDLINAGQSPGGGVIDHISDALKNFAGAANGLVRWVDKGEFFNSLNFGVQNQDIFGKNVFIVGFADAQDAEITGDAKTQYDNAEKDYKALKDTYTTQPYTEDTTSTFGEEALYNEIILAYDASQKRTVSELCKEFQQNYPNSRKIIDQCNNAIKLSNQQADSIYVTVNKETKQISFNGIYEPSFDEYGVRLVVASKNTAPQYFDLTKDKIIYLGNNNTDYLQLISADDNSSRIKTNLNVFGLMDSIVKEFGSDTITLKMNSPKDLGKGYTFTLTKVSIKKLAKVSVIPNIDNSGTKANFSFQIGIEKRAINLPPEQVKQMIKDLNSSIDQWQGISNSLGNATQTLKTACLVTSAALVAKNFLANTGGAGIARQTVMKGKNGWNERCADLVSKNVYSTQDECYSKNANKIDQDVTELTKIIDQQNSNIKNLEQGITSQQLLSDTVVNTSAFMDRYTPQVSSYVQQNLPDPVIDPKGIGAPISKSEILSVLNSDGFKKNLFTTDQLKSIELDSKVLTDSSASEDLKTIASAELYSTFSTIKTTSKDYQQISSWANSLNVGSEKISSLETSQNVKKIEYSGLTNGNLGNKKLNGFADNTPIALVQTFPDGKQYILVLDNSAGTSKLPIKNLGTSLAIYDSNGILVPNPPKDLANVYFEKYDSTSYKNSYKNAQLRYYETEPYKGMPAIVPFDIQNGWYAATKQTVTTSGGATQAYQASGRVNSFYLCNVGQNGLEEFQTVGDDTCEMINTGTGQPYNQFPGLSESDSRALVTKAVQAIEQASKLYKSGLSGKVKILNNLVNVGSPATNTPQVQCQDFMSPSDCLLMFNVCDPVICPSSRCDLGGAYPVQDVVQTGIIGSLVLCLPNAREGIILPVCLTGVKAGIDGFLSIQKAYRDCLQESLNSGKMIGICDEIYSIYVCDFFWRQAIPFADLIIPKVIEFLSGQNVRGGGEYLTVQSSWSTVQQSISYLIDSYGANSKAAFLSRSSENVGTELCKLYTSAVYPSGADVLDKLTQPDSPSQYHGRFDEIPLTTATNPPTSQYKVFYHIYAGQDSGAYYQVYLKGSPESSYYKDTSQSVSVASGYVALGGYADETKDFIATSGYTKLCISVNGQEDCGFKEVSTSFAVNYVKDQVVSSEASNTQIQKESDCISGFENGIIRVCATADPGKGTDSYSGTNNSRWQVVGYCDNEKIKCWIDTQSIANSIRTTTVENQTLNEVSQNYLNLLANESGSLSREQFSSAVQEINTQDDSSKITYINNIFDKVFWTDEKAELLLIRGNTYSKLFRVLWAQQPKPQATNTGTSTGIITTTTTGPTTVGTSIWTTAKSLVDSGWNEHRTVKGCGTADYSCIYGNVCARFVVHVLINSGVDIFLTPQKTFGTCSEDVCTLDSSGNMIFNIDSHSEWEAISNLIPKMLNSGQFIEVTKDNLVQGDVVILGLGTKQTQHAVIFDSYTADKQSIKTFGDPGESGATAIQTFAISSPTWYVYRAFRFTGNGISSTGQTTTGTTTENTTSSSTTTLNLLSTTNDKIYSEAVKLDGSSQNSAQFTSQALINAGVTGITIVPSVSSLISSIDTNINFVEVNVNIDTLQAGDIILLAKGCTKDNAGIYAYAYPQENNKIFFYSNTNGKVQLENAIFSSEIGNSQYIYKAYRYVESSVPSDKVQRTKWTVDSALVKVSTLIGGYTQNKVFVDQLVYDGILTQSECESMTGTGGGLFGFLTNTEGDMLSLKKILLTKRASSGEVQSIQ